MDKTQSHHLDSKNGSPIEGPAGFVSAAPPTLLTIREAATRLRLSRWMIYQLIRARRLETIQIGRRRLVPAAAIESLINKLRSEGTT